jgi:hypothetical protein
MPDLEFISFANELRTRAKEILLRATNTADVEVREMARVVAAGYEKLARRAEQRVLDAQRRAAR